MKLIKNKYFLAFLGFIFMCYYIWYRYIRERLPRDIPYNLSNLSFITLLIICFTYLYIILRLIRPKQPNKYFIKVIGFYSKLQIILANINIIIHENDYMHKLTENIILSFIKILNTHKLYSNNDKKIYVIFICLTKIPLILSLILDIFWFKQIYYFYYFLIINICSLIINYFLYQIPVFQDKYYAILKNYLIEITSEDDENIIYYLNPSEISYDDVVETAFDSRYKYLNVIHFINLQTTAIMWEDTPYNYRILHKSERQDVIHLSDYSIKTERICVNEINNMVLSSIDFRIVLRVVKYFQETKNYKLSQIIFYSLYLIIWTYTLLTADYSQITVDFISIAESLQNKEEPFSGLQL